MAAPATFPTRVPIAVLGQITKLCSVDCTHVLVLIIKVLTRLGETRYSISRGQEGEVIAAA
jgi:hypothetical protein